MAAIDATVIGIALPTIGRDFHASLGTLQWVVTGYTLTLASLLLLGGSLGDRFGTEAGVHDRGRLVRAGLCRLRASPPGPSQLIVTRILQGVGGALLTPGSLAILEASFVPDDRSEAIGAWSGLGGVATAAGPLVGGYLIAAASWRWIFLINVPLGVAVLLVSARHVPESRDPSATGRIDVLGAALATASLAAITYALIEGPVPRMVVVLGGRSLWWSGVAGGGRLRGGRAPGDRIRCCRSGCSANRQFAVTNAVTFVVYAGLGGVLFLLPVVLQVVDHYSPLESGVALLPLTLVMLVFSARSGRSPPRSGRGCRWAPGRWWWAPGWRCSPRAPRAPTYVTGVLPAVLVIAVGLATTVAPLTATALNSAPETHAGMASAVNNDVARIGALIAVAVLPALGGITGLSYLHPQALAHGFEKVVLIAGSWCVLGGLTAAIGIRNPTRPAPPRSPTGKPRSPIALSRPPR